MALSRQTQQKSCVEASFLRNEVNDKNATNITGKMAWQAGQSPQKHNRNLSIFTFFTFLLFKIRDITQTATINYIPNRTVNTNAPLMEKGERPLTRTQQEGAQHAALFRPLPTDVSAIVGFLKPSCLVDERLEKVQDDLEGGDTFGTGLGEIRGQALPAFQP